MATVMHCTKWRDNVRRKTKRLALKEGGVRFAGYPVSGRQLPMAICEVSAGALQHLGGLPDASTEELMGVFELHREAILEVAFRKFDAGHYRPRVTKEDFVTVAP